jgi:hypothetical protein
MHIEITYCQGNIPTSENDAVRGKRAQQKKAAMPRCSQMTRVESWNEQKAHSSRGLRRLLEHPSRRLAWRSSDVEGKRPSDGQIKPDYQL